MRKEICPKCGATLLEGAEACWQCNEKLPKRKSGFKVFLFLLVVAVIIAAAFFAYRYLK